MRKREGWGSRHSGNKRRAGIKLCGHVKAAAPKGRRACAGSPNAPLSSGSSWDLASSGPSREATKQMRCAPLSLTSMLREGERSDWSCCSGEGPGGARLIGLVLAHGQRWNGVFKALQLITF